MKKLIISFILLWTFSKSFACSCSSLKIVNSYSIFEFIGVVEFKSLNEISENGLFSSSYKVFEIFKGKVNESIYVESMRGSSCGFLPELKKKYLIFGYSDNDGKVKIAYCTAYRDPSENELTRLRELKELKIEKNVTSNLRQLLKGNINTLLFEERTNVIFVYKVNLDSNLKINKIIPLNFYAKNNFNKNISEEFKNKIHFKINEKHLGIEKDNLTSYIILNWSKDYEEKPIIEITKM